jgi:anti-sigma factor RsiW
MSELTVSPECEAARQELNAYVDGELAPEERMAIERHLEGCAACRAESELLRLVTQSLSLVPRPEPPEAMRQRLLTQVMAELSPRRMEIVCVERRGDRVIERQEVRISREPAVGPRLEPGPGVSTRPGASGPVIQQFRQELLLGPNCYQIVTSQYGRNNDERRA